MPSPLSSVSRSTAKCHEVWRLKVVKAKLSTACVSPADFGQKDTWEQTEGMQTGVPAQAADKDDIFRVHSSVLGPMSH